MTVELNSVDKVNLLSLTDSMDYIEEKSDFIKELNEVNT